MKPEGQCQDVGGRSRSPCASARKRYRPLFAKIASSYLSDKAPSGLAVRRQSDKVGANRPGYATSPDSAAGLSGATDPARTRATLAQRPTLYGERPAGQYRSSTFRHCAQCLPDSMLGTAASRWRTSSGATSRSNWGRPLKSSGRGDRACSVARVREEET
jgi:hypothetical protein